MLTTILWLFRIALIGLIVIQPIHWLAKIGIILIAHLITMFFLTRILIPRLGFTKSPLPKRLPHGIQRELIKLKGSQEKVLKKAYDVVTTKFTGERDVLSRNFADLFWNNHARVWKKGGVASCNTQVHFLRLLLVKSKKFKDEDIELIHHPLVLNIHQIMRVKLNSGWVYIDPWAKFQGIPFGRRIDYLFRSKFNPQLYKGIYRKSI